MKDEDVKERHLLSYMVNKAIVLEIISFWHTFQKFHYIINTVSYQVSAFCYRLRVVPLFETVTDLRGAGSVIRKLLSIDWYREHIIKNHNGHQEVLAYLAISCMLMSPENFELTQ